MPKSAKYVSFSVIAVLFLLASFILGYQLRANFPPASDKNLASIEQAWNDIVRDYVEPGKVDKATLSEAAIGAMVDSLNDPYSAYLDPSALKMENDYSAGKYEGIGAGVAMRDGKVTITDLHADSPAGAAGLRVGDIIMAVDGVSVEGNSLATVVGEVRGNKGMQVTLLVLHTGDTQPVTVTVTRGEIQTPSVTLEMKDDLAYIQILQFGDKTDAELAAILPQVNQQAKGIVLDLRNNPGGGLTTLIDVASRFIKDGTLLTVRYNDGRTETVKAIKQDVTTDLPVVVLVNRFSASAAEVLSGALQDHGRATIAGEVTYGKGSVNYLEGLPDGSAIYITAARWLTPNGNLIEGKGITPDVALDSTQDWVKWGLDYLHGKT
jgi:carboxyl-terminal processing protease